MLSVDKWILMMLLGLFQCVQCFASYTWAGSMVCQTVNTLRIHHYNDESYQRIEYLAEKNPSEGILCSDDHTICMRNVRYDGTGCQNITWDFEVQFGDQWGRIPQLPLSVPPGAASSLVYSFKPPFEQ